jgi:PAS domain S-box-containing protein
MSDPLPGPTSESHDHTSSALARLRDLERLVISLPVAVLTTDATGRIRSCNPACEQLFLWSAVESEGRLLDELLGMSLEQWLSGEGSQAGLAFSERLLRSQTVRGTNVALRRDGSAVRLELYAVPEIRHGQVNGMFMVFLDADRERAMLAIKAREERSLRPQEDLSRVTRELVAAQESERRRIAREIHDNLGQRFAMLQFALERIRRGVPNNLHGVQDGIDDLSNQIAETAAALQSLSRELHSQKESDLPAFRRAPRAS